MPPSLIATNYKANVSTGTCFIDVVRVKWLVKSHLSSLVCLRLMSKVGNKELLHIILLQVW